MTAENKANELILEYKKLAFNHGLETAKRCAIFFCDQTISFLKSNFSGDVYADGLIQYWHDVRIEVQQSLGLNPNKL